MEQDEEASGHPAGILEHLALLAGKEGFKGWAQGQHIRAHSETRGSSGAWQPDTGSQPPPLQPQQQQHRLAAHTASRAGAGAGTNSQQQAQAESLPSRGSLGSMAAAGPAGGNGASSRPPVHPQGPARALPNRRKPGQARRGPTAAPAALVQQAEDGAASHQPSPSPSPPGEAFSCQHPACDSSLVAPLVDLDLFCWCLAELANQMCRVRLLGGHADAMKTLSYFPCHCQWAAMMCSCVLQSACAASSAPQLLLSASL